MSDEPKLRICVGDAGRSMPGWLSAHWRDDADVPFRPGDDFPFEDRAVAVIACGDFVARLPRETIVRFLLECRRVLEPHGVLSLPTGGAQRSVQAPIASGTDIPHIAALVGLEPAGVTPIANDGRAALKELRAHHDRASTFEFTKRDRGVDGDPLVSILIPAYNPRFYAACLDSALAQTYDNIEIVVCDDSSDTEIEMLTAARVNRRRVRYLRNPVRLRVRGNYVKCFESARGEFVKFLCDDDVLAPTCVASLLDAFRRAPDTVLATSHRQRIDERGARLPDQPATIPIVTEDTTIAGYTLANAMLAAGLNTVGEPSTTLFRKAELLDQAPDYFRFNGAHGRGIIDMVTWSALLLKGNAVYLRKSLSSFRIHPGQRQHDSTKVQRNIESIRGLQAAWLDLELIEKVPPHLLLVKPFPPGGDADWRLQPVLSPFAVRDALPT